MSQASVPNITPMIDITIDDAINLIIASVAMEELGLSHILNAEGEKLQYVLGTLPGVPAQAVTISDLLAVNESIRKTLRETTNKDWVLSNKLEMALCASGDPISPVGPTGPTCVPFLPNAPCAGITCVPVDYSGPTPCVPLQLPTGTTCVPVPPPDCVLTIRSNDVICIPRSTATAMMQAPGC